MLTLVSDNLRITKAEIQTALNKKDPEPIKALIQKSIQCGAQAIDINTGPLPRNPETDMAFFISVVESVTHLPLFLDISNPRAMRAGLAAAHNKTVINGFSLDWPVCWS